MNDLVDRLAQLEREIAAERGAFRLFALFLRENAPDRWDLVVSAPWTSADHAATLHFLSRRLQAHLAPEELIRLSRIVLIDPSDPRLEVVYHAVQDERGVVELRERTFFDLPIRRAFVVASGRPDVGVPAS